MSRCKGKRHSAERIVRFLREAAGASTRVNVCGEYSISEQACYRWHKKYGAMEQSEVRKLKDFEEENRRLKHLESDL